MSDPVIFSWSAELTCSALFLSKIRATFFAIAMGTRAFNAYSQLPDTSAERVFAQVSPDVWMVKAALPEKGNALIGTAVLIAPSQLITACHVVKGAIGITLTNAGQSVTVTQVIRDPDSSRDMCLLRADALRNRSPVLVAPTAPIKIGQQVYAVASPRGLELTMTPGIVSSLRHEPGSNVPLIQTSTPVTGGSSGGGIFDEQGHLLGVIRSVASHTESFAFSYPAEWIVQLPQRYAREVGTWQKQMETIGVQFSADGNVISSGYASISDLTKLPVNDTAREAVALAYRQFLLLAPPRAFIFTGDGKFGTFGDAATIIKFREDSNARGVPFALYAVDGAVIWPPTTKDIGAIVHP